jgi:hypothetical protein
MNATSRTTRLLAVGAVAGAALLLPAQPASAATTTTTEHTTVDFGTFVEQSTPCTDEPVQWSGGYDLVITTVMGSTSSTRTLQYTQLLTGVGLTSGAPYLLTAQYHETVRSGDLGATIFVMPEVYVEISKGGSLNYIAREISVQVIDPNGVVVVDPEDDSHGAITCVG